MNLLKRRTLPLLMLAAFCAQFSACSHKHVLKDTSTSSEKDGGGVQVSVQWVKRKKNHIDLGMTIQNKYPFAVAIQENAVHLSVNQEDGSCIQCNPKWVLQPGDSFVQTLMYSFNDSGNGVATLNIDHITQGDNSVAPSDPVPAPKKKKGRGKTPVAAPTPAGPTPLPSIRLEIQ